MMSKKLTELVENQIKKSTEFWAGKPKMTLEELEAVQKFAKEKDKLFKKIFDSPEKAEEAEKLLKNALQ